MTSNPATSIPPGACDCGCGFQRGGRVWSFVPVRSRLGKKEYGFMLVDADVARWAVHQSWCVKDDYPYRTSQAGGVRDRRYLHREVMGAYEGDGISGEIDHINHDPRDARRCNLRVTTRAQNAQNCSAHRDARSRYRGVNFDKPTGKWRARACIEGVTHYLGYHDTEQEAADAAARFRETYMPYSEEASP